MDSTPKISVVIPCYTINHHLEELAMLAIGSWRDQADEVILVEDGGMYSPHLFELTDIYLYHKENQGFTVNVNRGWRYSTGDYCIIASSDTQLMQGNLIDLCIPGKVTSPEIVNQHIDRLAGPCFCVPKSVRDSRGLLREEMRIYSSDSEYDNRVADIFQKVPSVKVFHEQAQTVSAAGVEGGAQQQIDREAYQRLKELGQAK